MVEKRSLEETRKVAEQKKRESEERASITLEEFWLNDYFPYLKNRVKKVSWVREESHFKHWLFPSLGGSPLRDITANDLERLQDRIREKNLAHRSHEYILGTFRRIWKHANKRKIVLGECPVNALPLPNGESNARRRVVTPEELGDILKLLELTNKTAHDLVLFAAFSGCRASEAFLLTWENVDLAEGTALFPNTKNKESRRIFLGPHLVDMLKQRGPGQTNQLVFPKSDGKPYGQAPSAFRNAVKQLGLNDNRNKLDRVVFHTLRHTAATLTARRQTPLKDMQEIFGWRTPSMVFRYAKGDENVKRKAVAALEGDLINKATNLPEPDKQNDAG